MSEAEFDRRMAMKAAAVHPRTLTPAQARADLRALEAAVHTVWRQRWERGPVAVDPAWIREQAEADLPAGPVAFARFQEIAQTFLSALDDAHAYVMGAGEELGRIREPSTPVHWKRLAPDIGLLRIDRFPEPDQPFGARFPELIDEAFAALQDTRGLILDLRRNAGGDPNQADRLFEHLASTTVFLYYEVVRRSDALEHYLGAEKLRRWRWRADGFSEPFPIAFEPEDPGARYRGKLLALADSATVSAGEYVLAELIDNGLARFAGERTSGHSGSVVPTELPHSRLVVALPVQHVLRKDGTPLGGRGVVPHHPLDPRAPDLLPRAMAILRAWIAEERLEIKD